MAVDLNLIFARDRREIAVRGEVRRLTRLEAEVLIMLADAAPTVVGRDDMIAQIWQRRDLASSVVGGIVRELRKKLQGSGIRIVTVHRKGYYLAADHPKAE